MVKTPCFAFRNQIYLVSQLSGSDKSMFCHVLFISILSHFITVIICWKPTNYSELCFCPKQFAILFMLNLSICSEYEFLCRKNYCFLMEIICHAYWIVDICKKNKKLQTWLKLNSERNLAVSGQKLIPKISISNLC